MPNRFYVQPGGDITQGLSGITSTIQRIGEEKKRQAEADRITEMKRQAAEVYQTGDPEQIAAFGIQNPEMSQILTSATKFRDEKTKENYIQSIFEALQNPEDIENITARRQEYLKSRGLPPEETAETDRFMEHYREDPEGTMKILENELAVMSWQDPEVWKAYKRVKGGDLEGDLKVGAQEILEDGTIVQSTATGPIVYNPEGQRVKGKEAAQAVKRARAEKVSNLRLAAGGKKRASLEAEEDLKAKVEAGVVSAKAAADISTKAFDRLEKINTNIANIDEAIRLIDEGAETGVIKSKLPSVRAASIKLDNLQGRLGLDVIGSTTFGALSESELKFALDTALPQKLEGPELKRWLTEKKASQEKLSDYLEAAAIYLGTPGNTVAGWVQKQKEKRTTAKEQGETPPPAGNISTMSDEELKNLAFGGQ